MNDFLWWLRFVLIAAAGVPLFLAAGVLASWLFTLAFAPLCLVAVVYYPVRCGIHWMRTGELRFWPKETREQVLYREAWWRRTMADLQAGRY